MYRDLLSSHFPKGGIQPALDLQGVLNRFSCQLCLFFFGPWPVGNPNCSSQLQYMASVAYCATSSVLPHCCPSFPAFYWLHGP